jgi:hypothetical protein
MNALRMDSPRTPDEAEAIRQDARAARAETESLKHAMQAMSAEADLSCVLRDVIFYAPPEDRVWAGIIQEAVARRAGRLSPAQIAELDATAGRTCGGFDSTRPQAEIREDYHRRAEDAHDDAQAEEAFAHFAGMETPARFREAGPDDQPF